MKKPRTQPNDQPPPRAQPFAALAGLAVPAAPAAATPSPPRTAGPRRRLDVLRSTAHRGGKTVTVIKGFAGVPAAEVAALARRLQKACGAGGTVKDQAIEIQGDHCATVMRLLAEAGFRPVRAGG